MFKKLRNRIIIITMAVTTAVLLIAGGSIMFFSSGLRPEPEVRLEFDAPNLSFIKMDREEGNARLLATLISVGIAVEVAVFWVVYYLSYKIVEPVQDSYEKQKLFIANASHELKTPLAVIQANMEALEVSRDSQKWKDNIETEITHANKLVLDLLQLARMDAGETKDNVPEKINLKDELSGRIEIFKPKFDGKIVAKLNDKSEYVLPKQDILQVVDILLDNAVKYGDKKITVVLERGRISVMNDGATISKENTGKIFDRFYQTDKTREGSGLGLAIAKALCDQNGWQISCESGKELTTFSVRLEKWQKK